MTQFARPDADLGTSGTIFYFPASPATAWDKVDEGTTGDGNIFTISVDNFNLFGSVAVSFSNVNPPTVRTSHVLRFSARDQLSTGSVPLVVTVQQGGTVITTRNVVVNDAVSNVFKEYSFTLTSAEASNITNYSDLNVVFYGAGGGVTMHWDVDWVQLEVPDAPAITSQPQDQGVNVGGTATFTVAATASAGSLTYQWQRAERYSATFSNVGGATSASYTTGTLASSDNGARYRVVVTDSNDSVTSREALLEVGTASAVSINDIAPVPLALGFTTAAAAGSSAINVGGAPFGLEQTFSATPSATAQSFELGFAHMPAVGGGGSVDATVNATGVSATGAVGTVTVTAAANENASGVQGASAVGSVTVTAAANENASGVSATGSVGTASVTAAANENASGVSATSATGTASVTGDANENASGVAATGAVGNVAPTADANETATGNSAVSAVGSVAPHGDANENASGVSATGAVGDVTVTTGGSQDATVNVTGVSAVGAVGTVSIEITEGHRSRRLVRFRPIRDTAVKVSGVEAKAEVGYASITADKLYVAPRQETVLIAVDGVEAKASSGPVRISISCAVQASGVEAKAATSRAEIHGVTYIPVDGVTAHGDVGDARPIGDCAVVVNGVYAHGFTMMPSVKAIKNPTDDELMVIIAAAMRQKTNPRSHRRL